MKFKPTNKRGGILVELGPQEPQLPSLPSAEPPMPLPVFRLKKILVPVDFSELATKALQYAIPLARQFDAELSLVHVVQVYPPIPQMASVDIESIQDAKSKLAALRGMISDDIPCNIHVRTGEPNIEIVAAARAAGSDIIILATHGRSGLTRVLLGSTAEKVLRHASCPILVVREHEEDFIVNEAIGHEDSAAAKPAGFGQRSCWKTLTAEVKKAFSRSFRVCWDAFVGAFGWKGNHDTRLPSGKPGKKLAPPGMETQPVTGHFSEHHSN